jgi:hypothetical protein
MFRLTPVTYLTTLDPKMLETLSDSHTSHQGARVWGWMKLVSSHLIACLTCL